MNMTNLTDDCLYLIFCELNIKDQISVAKTCLRLNDIIINMIWNTKYAELYTWNRELLVLTKDECRTFIKLSAANVRKLRLTRINISSSIKENVQDISFYFQFKFPHLEEFDCENNNLNDDHIRLLAKNSPQLHTLSYNTTTGKNLGLMSNLKSLELSSGKLDASCLSELLSVNCLKTLALVGANKIDLGKAFRMASNKKLIVNLEELYISGYHATPEFSTYLHMFDNLKLLEVHFVEKSLNRCWLYIAKELAPRIHGLRLKQKFYYPSIKFDDISIADIITELKNIKYLEELDIEKIFNLNDTLPMIVNSLNLKHIHLHVPFIRKDVFENWLKAIVPQLEEKMKLINRPIITINLVEYSSGDSKAYLDSVQTVPMALKVMEFEPVLKKYKVQNIPKFAPGNCISFKLK